MLCIIDSIKLIFFFVTTAFRTLVLKPYVPTPIYFYDLTMNADIETGSTSASSSVRGDAAAFDAKECPVCFEVIQPDANMCITPCGHSFCFKCVARSMKNNDTCPICRSRLKDEDDADDADDETEYDEDEEDSHPEYSDGFDNCNLEDMERRILARGFKMIDLIALYSGVNTHICTHMTETSMTEAEYADHLRELENYIDDIPAEIASEVSERRGMAAEDRRASAIAQTKEAMRKVFLELFETQRIYGLIRATDVFHFDASFNLHNNIGKIHDNAFLRTVFCKTAHRTYNIGIDENMSVYTDCAIDLLLKRFEKYGYSLVAVTQIYRNQNSKKNIFEYLILNSKTNTKISLNVNKIHGVRRIEPTLVSGLFRPAK
jgi:hypothetical protein